MTSCSPKKSTAELSSEKVNGVASWQTPSRAAAFPAILSIIIPMEGGKEREQEGKEGKREIKREKRERQRAKKRE